MKLTAKEYEMKRGKRPKPAPRPKLCYCHTCDKPLHSLGVARHRAMHRDNRELCRIEFSDGTEKTFDFRLKGA